MSDGRTASPLIRKIQTVLRYASAMDRERYTSNSNSKFTNLPLVCH